MDADRASSCAPLDASPQAHECVLSFTSRPSGDERPVTARFHLSVTETEDGGYALLSPNVRWAVQG